MSDITCDTHALFLCSLHREGNVFPCVCFMMGWLVGLSTEIHKKRFATKLGWPMGPCPEQAPLTFGMDLDKGTDARTFSHSL